METVKRVQVGDWVRAKTSGGYGKELVTPGKLYKVTAVYPAAQGEATGAIDISSGRYDSLYMFSHEYEKVDQGEALQELIDNLGPKDFPDLVLTEAQERPVIATGIDATLAERESRYGDYQSKCITIQSLKTAMHESDNWCGLRPDMKESLEMIQHKIGRILTGDPCYHDSWHDIIGYAKLVADTLDKE